MDSIIQKLSKSVLPSGLVDNIKGYGKMAVSSISSFIAAAKSKLHNSMILSSEFVQCFTNDGDAISDLSLESTVEYDNAERNTAMIQSDSILATELNSFIKRNGSTTTDAESERDYYCINVSDDDGHICQLVAFDDEDNFVWCRNNNSESGFSPVIRNYQDRLYLHNYLHTLNGQLVSVWDMVYAQSQNSALMTAMYNACERTVSTDNDDPFPTVIQEWTQSGFAGVRKFASQVASAFAQGGIYGVVALIYNYIKGGATASVDSDGLLVFADPNDVMVKEYTAGLWNAVSNVVVTIVSVLATILNRVIGLLTSVIGSLFTQMIGSINYDYQTATVASLNDSLKVEYPCAPHGLFQHERSVNLDYVSQALVGTGVWASFVPGGQIIYIINSDGTMRSEFHPDLVDRRPILKEFVQSQTFSGQTGISVQVPDKTITEFLEYIDQYELPGTQFVNNSLGVLDSADSDNLYNVICANVALYFIYCILLHNSRYPSDKFMNFDAYYTLYSGNDAVNYRFNNDVSFTTVRTYGRTGNENAVSGVWMAMFFNIAAGIDHPSESSGTSYYRWQSLYRLSIYTTSDKDYAYTALPDIVSFDCKVQCFSSEFVGETMYIQGTTFGTPQSLSYNHEWAVKTPKYDRSSFISNLILSCVAVAAVTAVTIASAFALRKFMQVQRAKLTARAEQAWNNMTENPSDANVATYRKAVLKNNMFATVFGGNKIDMSSYWGGSESGSTTVINKVANAVTNYTSNGGNDPVSGSADTFADLRSYVNRLILTPFKLS